MKKRSKFFLFLLVMSMISFEIYSGSSVYQALLGIFGIKWWAWLLAFAFVAVDFGSVGLYFSGIKIKEPIYITFAWLLSAIGDNWFSYLIISAEAQKHLDNPMITSGTISVETFTRVIPLLLTFLSWLTEVGLVASLNTMISSAQPITQKKIEVDTDW
jgi:hypothetical protein